MSSPSRDSAGPLLDEFFAEHPRMLVITGAGCSTASGIGDYRDAEGAWKRAAPVQLGEFLRHAAARQRYWARSMHGWMAFHRARPNAAHTALAALEAGGAVSALITQNVDGLHQAAGHRSVIELHGGLRWVVCLGCGHRLPRSDVQARLIADNAYVLAASATLAPDGDADLLVDDLSAFKVPACERCGGMLKPDVVFYGESVPKERVQDAYAVVDSADAVLVVGSSLMVFSVFRFLKRARQLGLPMAAVNRGLTRADQWLRFKIDGDCQAVLAELATRVLGAGLPP